MIFLINKRNKHEEENVYYEGIPGSGENLKIYDSFVRKFNSDFIFDANNIFDESNWYQILFHESKLHFISLIREGKNYYGLDKQKQYHLKCLKNIEDKISFLKQRT